MIHLMKMLQENMDKKFRMNAWKGFIVADYIRKIYRETRPYEINKGESDRVYENAIKKLEICIEKGSKAFIKY